MHERVNQPEPHEPLPPAQAGEPMGRGQPAERTTSDVPAEELDGDWEHTSGNVMRFRGARGPREAANEPTRETSELSPLMEANEAAGLRSRWDAVQAEFVDDPRRAVQDADHLVAEAIQRLAQIFGDERAKLEGQWSRGDDVSTEDLRIALQRYRSFFQRVLTTGSSLPSSSS